jgi:hypothetical protein
MTALLDAVNMAESAHLITSAMCGAESETEQTNFTVLEKSNFPKNTVL